MVAKWISRQIIPRENLQKYRCFAAYAFYFPPHKCYFVLLNMYPYTSKEVVQEIQWEFTEVERFFTIF